MGPRSKKRAAAAESGGAADGGGVEDNKSDNDAASTVVVQAPRDSRFIWQLEDKNDCWCSYSGEVCEALTAAAVLGRQEVDVEAGPRSKLKIDLETLVQRGKTTKKKIRCLIEKEDCGVYWSIENGGLLAPGIAARIEQMRDMGSVAILQGAKYDLVNMTRELDGKTETIVRKKVMPAKFKKTSITGKIVVTATKVDDDDDVSPAKKAKVEKSAKKSKSKSANVKTENEESPTAAEEEKPIMKSIVRKGLAPVDLECPHSNDYHVHTEGREVWDAMLNQTNIQGNNNKYYLMQLLKADSGNRYAVWMRWGRVGYKGQNSWQVTGTNLEEAKRIFTKKFQDKTKNAWEDRENFEKCPGKYDLVLMDYSAGKEGQEDTVDGPGTSVIKSEPLDKKPVPESSLEQRVQDLITLICDIKTMEQSVVEMEYDTKKAPLGKITTAQIKAGYEALKKISACLDEGKTSGREITEACNDFYTRIPHEFGFRVPPMIRSHAEVKKKIGLLEALSDIQVALKLLSVNQDDSTNPVDRRYNQLKVDINALDKADTEWKLIEKSIQDTHASTHTSYTMEVQDVFKIDKHGEEEKWTNVGNTRLLYHGSRLSNWAGILGQGLRIAPPEAPVTGYMFGKGVYFADMSSKSANYCWTTRTNNIGLLLICEVALGQPNKLVNADYNADKLPSGCHSVQGLGRIEPGGTDTLPSGLAIPTGKPKKTKVENKSGFTLQYNEFIVYNTNQIKMKYLAKIKFNHKY